jgi:hypothetical protein
MARISNSDKTKIISFMNILRTNPTKNNLEAVSSYWYEFLVDLTLGYDYISKLTEIPFYHHSLYEQFKDIYDNILEGKAWQETHRRWNQILPSYNLTKLNDNDTLEYPCIIFPIMKNEKIIEFIKREDKILSTIPLDRYDYLRKSKGIIDYRINLAKVTESGNVKIINSVNSSWTDLINKENTYWLDSTIETIRNDLKLKAKGYKVKSKDDLIEILRFIDDIEKVICIEETKCFSRGYKIIERSK